MYALALAPGRRPPRNAVPHPTVGPPDPVFAAVRALDRAADEHACAFEAWTGLLHALDPLSRANWEDTGAVVRSALGRRAQPTLRAVELIERRLALLGPVLERAEERFASTRPTTEIGVAAYRAAARRYAQRPGGHAVDEHALLARLQIMLAEA